MVWWHLLERIDLTLRLGHWVFSCREMLAVERRCNISSQTLSGVGAVLPDSVGLAIDKLLFLCGS